MRCSRWRRGRQEFRKQEFFFPQFVVMGLAREASDESPASKIPARLIRLSLNRLETISSLLSRQIPFGGPLAKAKALITKRAISMATAEENDIQGYKGLVRIIFEKGIETQVSDDGNWYFQSVRHGEAVRCAPSLENNPYTLRPLLLVYDTPQGLQENLLPTHLPPANDLYFCVETGLLGKALSVTQFHDLIYVFGEAAYHCKLLAYEYCRIAKNFAQAKGRFEGEETGESFAIVHDCNVIYEFDALITAVIRCYSMIRIVLWSIYCAKLGRTPRFFEGFLNKSENDIPTKLHAQLRSSWKDWGDKARHYRNFIQHDYTLTENGWPLPKTKHLGDNIWCISVFLPDNPKEESRDAFVFDKHLDALTYGWELVARMETVFLAIANSLPSV